MIKSEPGFLTRRTRAVRRWDSRTKLSLSKSSNTVEYFVAGIHIVLTSSFAWPEMTIYRWFRGESVELRRMAEGRWLDQGTDGRCAHELDNLLFAHVHQHGLMDLGPPGDLLERLDERLVAVECQTRGLVLQCQRERIEAVSYPARSQYMERE